MKEISRGQVVLLEMGNKNMYQRNMMSMPLMIMVLGITVISFTNAQTLPLCVEELSPCIAFVNSTNPPDTCCNPIKEINATQKTCFCQLALTPGILEGLGTTTTQAVQILHLCGVNFTVTSCKASSAPPPSASTLVQPPAMLGRDEGGTDKAKLTGFSFALFFCAWLLIN